MALWGSVDRANNAPKHTIVAGVSANGQVMYANNTANVFVSRQTVGVFGVSTTEQNVAGNPKGGHAGWVKLTTGQGGRAGRVHVETLVAMGSISGDGDVGDPVANDDVKFADS